ncbi:MAG: trimethylamine methyltransferase family protein, partial [Anaerolineales bacterium]|nr:trimethylamine methyltransferase family protein [Anaerolineales bacterium]
EIFITKLAERQSWHEWERAGRVNMVDRAEAKAREILDQHQVPPLDRGQEQELDAIMEEAAKKLN